MIHTLMFRMTDIPKDVQTHCKLEEKATEDGLVYMEVKKVIDSLPKQTCRPGITGTKIIQIWVLSE